VSEYVEVGRKREITGLEHVVSHQQMVSHPRLRDGTQDDEESQETRRQPRSL